MIRVPKLVDCHVHFRQPGLEAKGNFATESLAAYIGGVDVVCDMPNTKPPTQTVLNLKDKVLLATCASCDIRFFFGATSMNHLQELKTLWTDLSLAPTKMRCSGLKLYLDNSTGNLRSDESVTVAAFEMCGELGIPLVAHCEHAETNEDCGCRIPYSGPASHSERRPPISEVRSIDEAIRLAKIYNTQLHIAHLSTSEGLASVVAARKSGIKVTCEVTAHHLFLSTDDYDSQGAFVKVNPPVRSIEDRDALWQGLLDGHIDCVVTDHAPHTAEEKAGENPPSGIPGVELVVPLLLTACSGRWPHPTSPPPRCWKGEFKLNATDIVRLMHTNPNKIFSLGLPSEPCVLLDTELSWTVEPEQLHSKVKWSPYLGWTLLGKAVRE